MFSSAPIVTDTILEAKRLRRCWTYELRNASCILTFSSIEYSNGSDVYLYSLADYANRELIRGLLEQG